MDTILSESDLLFSILEYLDDVSRESVPVLNRGVWQRFQTKEAYHWRLQRLEEEHGVYYGGSTVFANPSPDNLRELYQQHFRLRHMWNSEREQAQGVPNQEKDSFQTRISVRFKPNHESALECNPTKTASLPLSQRLALLKISCNLSSNREALLLLGKLGGIGCATAAAAATDTDTTNDSLFISSAETNKENLTNEPTETVTLNQPLTNTSMTTGIHTIDPTHNRVIVVDRTTGLKDFPFDKVLPAEITQQETYQRIGHPSVRALLCGDNATLLMYGQTGAGKTHTMMGSSSSSPDNGSQGILPRACQELFQAIQQRQHHPKRPIYSKLSVSYVEVYGNEVTDLLRNGEKVSQNMAAAHRMVLEGQASRPVSTFPELMTLLERGEQQRKVAATAMNERSSRAHSLFFLNLTQTCGTVTKQSRLILGDLGGAEQLKKSQANDTIVVGSAAWKARTREAIHINQGLLSLKNCVNALNQKASFVPYGDSKLTMLLSAGLMPATATPSQTQIVICASQDPQHATETIASLQFAQACRGIQQQYNNNNSHTTTDELVRHVLQDLEIRIQECRERIQQEERWETQQLERPDGEYGMEIYTVTKLTGAEHLNEELEHLLNRRAELTGIPVEN